MRYLIRSLKYFLNTVVLLSLFIFILVQLGFIDSNIDKMFVHGIDSVWTILAIFAAFSLIYPKTGYSKRLVYVSSDLNAMKDTIAQVMEAKDYKLESESADKLCYIKRTPFQRAMKLWEDRVTIVPVAGGLELEGITKDILRIKSSLEIYGKSEEE